MLGMGLRASELSTATIAKRSASPKATTVVRTSTKRAARSSADLPRPPASTRK